MIGLASWLSLLEVEVTSDSSMRLLAVTFVIGGWMIGSWFMKLRLDAQRFPADPRYEFIGEE